MISELEERGTGGGGSRAGGGRQCAAGGAAQVQGDAAEAAGRAGGAGVCVLGGRGEWGVMLTVYFKKYMEKSR